MGWGPCKFTFPICTNAPRNCPFGTPIHTAGEAPVHHLQSPPAHMNRVQFSPDGLWLAGTNQSGFVHLWDAIGGQQAEILTGHHTTVMSMAWQPQGGFLATSDMNGKLRIWHPTARGGGYILGHHVFDVGFTSISPDGRLALSGSRDGTFGIWDLHGGHENKRVWSAHSSVSRVFALEGNKTAAVMLNTAELQLWDLDRLERTESRPLIDRPKAPPIGLVTHSGRKSLFAIGNRHPDSSPSSIEEWSQESLQFKRAYTIKNSDPLYLAIDETRDWLLIATKQGRLEIFDLNTEETRVDVQITTEGRPLRAISYSPEKTWALCMSRNNRATLVDANSGESIRTLWTKEDVIQSGTFLQSGDRVALGTRRGTISVWVPLSGNHLIDLKNVDGWVGGLAASPNGKALLAGTSSGTLHYIDCLTAAQRFESWAEESDNTKTKLASQGNSHKEAGRVAWSQLWNESDIPLHSPALLMARMQYWHPNPAFVSALRSSLAFLQGRFEACIQHADLALTHPNLGQDTRSTLLGIRGISLLRQGQYTRSIRDHIRVPWLSWLKILKRERQLNR